MSGSTPAPTPTPISGSTPTPTPTPISGSTPPPASTPTPASSPDPIPGPEPGPPPRRTAPYRRLLALPGARAFAAGSLVARLPMGMFSVSAVVMIAGTRGSYALAGAVTATGLAATALVAPWTARLVDRYGQARVAVPATLCAALGSLALVLCVRTGAPDWTLFAAYAATATTPNTGGMSRARWTHLLGADRDALHTANSFEQAADELCFMLGPALAAFLCGTFFPEAGTLTGVALLVTGVLVFAAQRSTEPPPQPRTKSASPLRSPGFAPLLAVCLALGAVFGATEVVTIAFADARGHATAAGAVLALQAAGSCAAGLVYGAARPSGPASRRHPWNVAAMTVLLTLPLLASAAAGSLPLLAGALLVAGTATAPTMVTTMALIQERTPEGRLNEGMTLAVTGLLGGIACGSAIGGRVAEHVSPAAGFAVPVAASATALLLSLAAAGTTDRTAAGTTAGKAAAPADGTTAGKTAAPADGTTAGKTAGPAAREAAGPADGTAAKKATPTT
ncbi:MFS transporter [Streptomyces sp. NPDC002328]|uniref:MFS transporter n=1 Tax=Streptomyces sp. NPDC002328 TaxID=3364642 RepID=UPI00369B7451